MNRIFTALMILFGLQSGIASGQDKIVPMPIEYSWPLHSPALDSVEYYYAQGIARNKVKFCIQFNEDGSRLSQTFYDTKGRITNRFYNTKDIVSNETIYIRNSAGQVIEKRDIDYTPTDKRSFLYEEIDKLEYVKNLPSKYFYHTMRPNLLVMEALYNEDILTGVNFNYNGDTEVKFTKPVTYEKDYRGNKIRISTSSSEVLFESDEMDSIVVGEWTYEYYQINKNKIIRKEIRGIDYSREVSYIYKENGLIDFEENTYHHPITKEAFISRINYRYSYYED